MTKPRRGAASSANVYALFALSGASALIYQVIWARWLGLVFGNTTLSISTVLACFMLGLAAGSRWAGARVRTLRDPMRWYAFAELGIGLYALISRPMIGLADAVFTALVRVESPAAYSLFVRAGLAAAVLLIPTMLMGATLPLLSEHFKRGRAENGGWRVGLLYAANTAGAAAGILLAGFALIELIGVLDSALFAAALNFVVALIALRLSDAAPPPAPSAPAASRSARGFSGAFALWTVAWSGALALASEVLWTRALETIVGNSTYAFSSIVVLYLCGIALGSWAASRAVDRLRSRELWLAGLLLGMGAWTLAAVGLFGVIARSLAPFSFLMMPVSAIFGHELAAMSVLFPLALMSGACFPLATRLLDPESADASGALVADVYSWNTLGAVLGSAAGGFLLAPRLDGANALYALAALYAAGAAVAALVLASRRTRGGSRAPSAALAAAAAAVAVFSAARASDAGRYAREYNARDGEWHIVFHRPGLQGVTSVAYTKKGRRFDALIVNGMSMTLKVTDTKMMAHLPMVLHPKPENVLVICLGMGTTFRSALAYGGRVTVVELVKEVVDALGYFTGSDLRENPRGRIFVNDGRNFLKLSRETYDVITVDPPPPIDAAGVNSLYSREFLELAKSRLNPGGIMAHWVPYPGVQGGVDDGQTELMLLVTFAQVFPYAYFHRSASGVGVHVLGSLTPLDFSLKSVRAKLANKAVAADMNEWDRVPPDFFTDGWIRPTARDLETAPVTDDRPLLEFYLLKTLARGGKKMHPESDW